MSSYIFARYNSTRSAATLPHCFAAVAALALAATPTVCFPQEALVVPSAQTSVRAITSIPDASAGISRFVPGDAMLHVVVGHSLFLKTKLRLHRVYIADPAVLNSVTLSENQIVVTAITPGVSTLVLQDEAGRAQSYVISSDVDVQGLRVAMDDAMHGSAVNVQGIGGRVILSGTVDSEALNATAVKLAALYSKDVADSISVDPGHPRQVRLKVRILEVDRSKLNQFGVNLFNPGGNTSFLASTTTSQYPSTSTLTPSTTVGAIGSLATSNPLNFLLYSAKLNLGATVQDLESKNILQILAEPTITTISGHTASFLSGGEFPFPMVQPGGGSGTSSTVTIEFKPYGVKLAFTPIVNDDGTILLKVAPEVSALDYSNAVSISGYTIPALSTRKADTEVELRNNQSFAISGLLDQRTTDLYSKTPGIASIPILGALFKSKNINHSTTELIVVITPSIVDPLTDTVPPSQPQLPIPTLNSKKFDNSLGKDHNPNPAAPALTPNPTVWPGQTAVTPATAPTGGSIATIGLDNSPQGPSEGPESASIEPVAMVTSTPGDNQTSWSTGVSEQPQQIGHQASSQTASKDVQKGTTNMETSPPLAHPMVQVMALTHKQDADAMVEALKRRGYNVAVVQDPRNSVLHLELGPFTNKADAEVMRQRLLLDGYDATIQ